MNSRLKTILWYALVGVLAAISGASFASSSHTEKSPAATVILPDDRDAERADRIRQLRNELVQEDAKEQAEIRRATQERVPASKPMNTEELRQRYANELNREIRRRWNSKSATPFVKCTLMFEQIPGGEVIRIEFLNCPYAAPAREAIERALIVRELPYAGFESVFSRQISMTLCVPEQECK